MTLGSAFNIIMSNGKSPVPVEGMGVTRLDYTDRHPGTIRRVLSPSRILVTMDHCTRIDNNGMSEMQKYKFETVDGPLIEVTLRKDGRWRKRKSNEVFALGYRSRYHDYSF